LYGDAEVDGSSATVADPAFVSVASGPTYLHPSTSSQPDHCCDEPAYIVSGTPHKRVIKSTPIATSPPTVMQAQSSGAADSSEAITPTVTEADATAIPFQTNARQAATASTARSISSSHVSTLKVGQQGNFCAHSMPFTAPLCILPQIGARKHGSKKRSFVDMSTTPASGSDIHAAGSSSGTILHSSLASALPINGTGTKAQDAVGAIDVNQQQTEVDNLGFATTPCSAIRSNITIGATEHIRHQQEWAVPEENSDGIAPLFGHLPLGGGDDVPLDGVVHEPARNLPLRNNAASGGRSLFNASTSEIPDEGRTLERASDEVLLDSEHLKPLKFGNSQNIPMFDIACYDADPACGKLVNVFENSFSCDNVELRLQSGQEQPDFDEIQGEDGVGNYLSSVNPVAPPHPYP
jgi:hypothetical protein